MSNYIQILKENEIQYETHIYPEEISDTTLVAKHININPNQLFKSLVIIVNNIHPLLLMIPSNSHLNIVNVQSILAIGPLKFATIDQAEKYTKMKVGGISPLGLLDKNIPIYISDSILSHKWIVMSAGERGVTVKITVEDFVNLTKAQPLPAKSFTEMIATK